MAPAGTPRRSRFPRPPYTPELQPAETLWVHVDEPIVNRHFDTLADPDAVVLLLDQAGWHLARALVVPGNITLLPLPPQSPELNPVENVWQFLRDNWHSNRVFKGYDDIVAHCCAAWNDLVDQPWRMRSIGKRAWAEGF